MPKAILLLLCIAVYNSLTAQKTVNYKICQSPVKDQVDRGTCTGFAIAACLETFPGTPADLSEQYIYAGLKMPEYGNKKNIQGGGNIVDYSKTLVTYGWYPEKYFPYNKNQLDYDTIKDMQLVQLIREGQTGPVSMLVNAKIPHGRLLNSDDYETGQNEQAQDVERIKRYLDAGHKAVAVSYLINSDFQNARPGNSLIKPTNVIIYDTGSKKMYSPEQARLLYGNNFMPLINSYKNIFRVDTFSMGGHAVTVVGYNKDGFIIKNSWDKTLWGDAAYATISYDYHKLMAVGFFLIKKIHFVESANKIRYTPQTDLRLKVIPQGFGRGLNLSFVLMEKDASLPISIVEYKIYHHLNGTRKLLETKTVATELNPTEYFPDFNTDILNKHAAIVELSNPKNYLEVEATIYIMNMQKPVKKVYTNIYWKYADYR